MDTFVPTKYQSPLIIDSDAIKTSPITFQCFEPFGRRGSQILQTMGTIQGIQFTQGNSHNFGRKAAYARCFPSVKQVFRRGIPKGTNRHREIIMLTRYPCKTSTMTNIRRGHSLSRRENRLLRSVWCHFLVHGKVNIFHQRKNDS